MRCAVVVFPGSNCDHDAIHVLENVFEQTVERLWHDDDSLKGAELVVLPGGFSYGDYLRAGSLAALSPIMAAVKRHADRGGLVLGICNGFQVLLEAGLLPGALRPNKNLRFECRDVRLRVERNDIDFTRGYEVGQVLRIPIAHAEGRYEDRPEALDRLERERGVVLRYVDASGATTDEANVNGSARAIAGVTNRRGNVLGMMPHPERASEVAMGGEDGRALFAGLLESTAPHLEASQP